jgi:pyruvate/2-oxoglutarate/acetoin dehydrogenase E1 component
LDEDCILSSVRKTNRVVVVSEDVSRGGVTSELSTLIMDKAFDFLDAPVVRVAADNTPVPFGPAAEKRAIPQTEDILAAVHAVLRD